jgi:hypothetical protein
VQSIPQDDEGDFDLNIIKINKLKYARENGILIMNNKNLSLIDQRYNLVDSMDLKEYLIYLKVINKTQIPIYSEDFGEEEKTFGLYSMKLLYSKKECVVAMYKIVQITDIYTIGQMRTILLRYLNWNFIDIIFIISLNLYLRGFYIVKKLRKIKYEDDAEEEDEKKFHRETSTVVKLLHYFIIIIKIISGLVAKYIYMDSSLLPDDSAFFDKYKS